MDKSTIIQNDYKLKVLELLKQDKKSAFNGIRKVLLDSKVTDYAELFRLLYDNIEEYAKGHLAEVILVIAKYELSDAHVVDKEINFMSLIIRLLRILK